MTAWFGIAFGVFGVAGAATIGWLVASRGKWSSRGAIGVLGLLWVAFAALLTISLVVSFRGDEKSEVAETVRVDDNFDDGRLGALWRDPTDGALIAEDNGALNFTVDREHTPRQGEESVSAELPAVPEGERLIEAEFTVTLTSYEADVPGGVRLNLFLANGQVLYIDVGPSPDGPGSEFVLCETIETDYDDCKQEDGPEVIPEEPLRVRAAWVGSRVDFFLDERAAESFTVNEVPITNVGFFVYADPGSVFHAIVDDFQATYEND